ncbi:hypothetical protein VEE31_06820 [Escherichia coli]|nr:hypothetical protein VEE31_06820 [Escherichia coli]
MRIIQSRSNVVVNEKQQKIATCVFMKSLYNLIVFNLLIFNAFIFMCKNILPVIYLVFVWLLTA